VASEVLHFVGEGFHHVKVAQKDLGVRQNSANGIYFREVFVAHESGTFYCNSPVQDVP